jgi:hypothetical protein
MAGQCVAMITGLLLTIALFGALGTVRYSIMACALYAKMGMPSTFANAPKEYKRIAGRYGLTILLYVAITITAAFFAGVWL